jgi:hypothetical protein
VIDRRAGAPRHLSRRPLAIPATTALAASPKSLETVAERSGFRITGRYDEVERLCAELAKAFPGAVRAFEFGRTPEGRPMLALAVSKSGALTPDDARERGVPVMVAQGGIHAGEIDGKDAGFLAVREMLQGKAAKGALDSFVLVFVPVFNVDSHERFGRYNRPNQNGPENGLARELAELQPQPRLHEQTRRCRPCCAFSTRGTRCLRRPARRDGAQFGRTSRTCSARAHRDRLQASGQAVVKGSTPR